MLHSCPPPAPPNSQVPTAFYLVSLGQSPLLFMLTHTLHDANSPRKFLVWFMSNMWNTCLTYVFAWEFISRKPGIVLKLWRVIYPEGHWFINLWYHCLVFIAAKWSVDSPAPTALSALPLHLCCTVCLCAVFLCSLSIRNRKILYKQTRKLALKTNVLIIPHRKHQDI